MLTKRKNYGCDGVLVASFPRAPRSARGKSHRKRTVENGELFAIELLASLAGELLQGNESSASSNASAVEDVPTLNGVKQEKCESVVKTENHDSLDCVKKGFIERFELPGVNHEIFSNGSSGVDSDSLLECCSAVNIPSSINKMAGDLKSKGFKSEGSCKNTDEDVKLGLDGVRSKMFSVDSSKGSMDLCLKVPELLSHENGARVSPYEGIVNNMFGLKHRNNWKLPRDNDDKFLKVYKSFFRSKSFRSSSCIGDRRIRKLLVSKYWKLAPKLKDYEHSSAEPKRASKRKRCEKRKFSYDQIYHKEALYKRQKYSGCHMRMNSDGGFNTDNVCNSPENAISTNKDSSVIMHDVNGLSASGMPHLTSSRSKDSHVKFSIRSFRIPDLLIEVPKTASIASLKRTVMEAFSSLVRDGLGIGVLLQGKKVRDDSRTLLQSGITSNHNLDTLGFTLEPTDLPSIPVNSPLQLSHGASQLTASCLVSTGVGTVNADLKSDPPVTCLENEVGTKCEPASFSSDIVSDNLTPNPKALVTVPSASDEPLAIIPLVQKPKRSDHVQRRTRRPFSVAEVEALVEAIEELGTGRWRDVKLRSFENADHRTYVDLKDKWKTLVHTAKIAPQQRRGEPVPQELLDRVLAAHALWSQHPKAQPAILRISDSPADQNAP